jgi:SAM-dependent methyltransferase
MLDRARMKIAGLPEDVRGRITLLQADALADEWPAGFDVVILGANCLFEFELPEEQIACIRNAAVGLRPGGRVFVDNNARRGPLNESALQWRGTWPSGTCEDGTRIESESAIVRIDPRRNLWYKTRTIRIIDPAGQETQYYDETCRHPVSMEEVCRWLADCGFTVLALFGSRQGEPFTEESGRALFWARKIENH